MKYYIAYKYSNNKNREDLKKKLEKVSEKIHSWGHETFLLGRDVKKWRHIHFGSIKLIPVIFRNMRGCDILFAYVDSPTFSKGLFFEVVISKLLRKKSVLVLEGNLKSKFFRYFFGTVKKINSVDEISQNLLS